MKTLRFLVAAAFLALAVCAVAATSPMKIVVPFASGGGGDLIARLLAPRLGEALGRPVFVENKAGASGQLGMQYAKAAPADGSVVVLASDQASVVVPLASAAAGYDTARDFVGLGRVAQFPYALAVSKAAGVETLREFIDFLRRHPSQASVATPSSGGIPELAAVALGRRAGVAVTPVPYSGAAPVVAPLLGGQLTAAVLGFNNVLPLHKEGRVRVLAVTGAARTTLAPEIPTFEESGMPGVKLVSNWTFYAPRGLPAADAERFNAALNRVLAQPGVVRRIEAMSMDVAPTTLEQTREELDRAVVEWTRILRRQGAPAR